MAYDYEKFKAAVLTLTRIDLNAYKERQMKRRIDALISKHGIKDYESYIQVLKTDKTRFEEFINYLTINVSEFYRNPDQWRLMDKEIIPELIGKFGKTLKIWSAACSTGDEPYSLVMALSRHIPLNMIRITATDLDKQVIAKAKVGESRGADVVKNWMRNRATLEFLGTWEQIYNPAFKVVEFDHFKSEAGLHTFVLSVSEWIEKTEAIGLFVKRGKYGGTYAHKDIAFEFASAISPVFKLYLIKEFQRLKEVENDAEKIEWDAKRFLSKNNYLIQTDAVKNYLIPSGNYKENLEWLAYAEEADILNVALFGFTAKAWRDENPELAKKNNVRDFASINELTVLSNLETHNAQMIREGRNKTERFQILQEIAEYQLNVLKAAEQIKLIVEK